MEKDEMIRPLIMTRTDLVEILKCQKKNISENTKWDPETAKGDH